MNSKIRPADPFPANLTTLPLEDLELLNSRVHRMLDTEYERDGQADTETQFRLHDLTEELDRRDSACATTADHSFPIGRTP